MLLASCLLASCLLASSSSAQTCNAETGGASGTGSKCNDGAVDTAAADTSTDTATGGFLQYSAQSQVVPFETNDSGVLTVTGNRTDTVHLASGEFRFALEMFSLGGMAKGGSLDIGALYRAYLVNPGGSVPDYDPTGGSAPFGPGWQVTFAEGILKGADATSSVTYVDSKGVAWPLQQLAQQPQSGGFWYFPAKGGSRMVAHVQGNATTWYRELPNKVLIEYEKKANYSSLPIGQVGYRIKRRFRGEWGATPDWQVFYTYAPVASGGPTRLTRITDTRGYQLVFAWTQQAGGVYRVTTMTLTDAGATQSFAVTCTYDAQARLEDVRYPNRRV